MGSVPRVLAVLLAFVGVAGAGGHELEAPNPFFQSLGATGRACSTCHVPADGWSIAPSTAQRLFDATAGRHPLFRPHDAANAPSLPDATAAERRSAYSLLLTRGLIRVGLPVPAGADFVLDAVDDPYGFASARELSLFRRPPPVANLTFAATVMWDGRHRTLDEQAASAAAEHLQGVALTTEQRRAIVGFERELFTTPALAQQRFFPAINTRGQGGFDRRVFTLFGGGADTAVARGEAVFNERTFAFGTTTCSSCHNTPNAGSNSLGLTFDLGVSDESRRTGLPLYTLRCIRGGRGVQTGALLRTTDPGVALVSGRCDDVGRFKVPTLRGLAARAPYLHNGSAATLDEVVAFYDTRFAIRLTAREREDLLAFLRML